jgi:hypothetical protein
MLFQRLAIGIAAASILIYTGSGSRAEEKIRELPQASVSLDQAFKASDGEGNPISAEYDVEDGWLQISVYAKRGEQFSEVIVDPKSRSIVKTKLLTDSKEINEAEAQSEAIAKAKFPLEAALGAALNANSGYRAVSVILMLGDDEAVAAITLMSGEGIKTVMERLE